MPGAIPLLIATQLSGEPETQMVLKPRGGAHIVVVDSTGPIAEDLWSMTVATGDAAIVHTHRNRLIDGLELAQTIGKIFPVDPSLDALAEAALARNSRRSSGRSISRK